MKLQVVADNVSNGLRVCSRTGAATVNVIRDLGQLVRKAVGDVGTGTGTGIGTDDDAAVELNGHNGRAGAVLRS